MTGYLTMLDSIPADQLPAGDSFAYAGYMDGEWADYDAIRARFPHAHVLSIAVFASHDADCLDIESGDATPDEAAGWYERQKARGVERPCLYASADAMEQEVVPILHGGRHRPFLGAAVERSLHGLPAYLCAILLRADEHRGGRNAVHGLASTEPTWMRLSSSLTSSAPHRRPPRHLLTGRRRSCVNSRYSSKGPQAPT